MSMILRTVFFPLNCQPYFENSSDLQETQIKLDIQLILNRKIFLSGK